MSDRGYSRAGGVQRSESGTEPDALTRRVREREVHGARMRARRMGPRCICGRLEHDHAADTGQCMDFFRVGEGDTVDCWCTGFTTE